MRHLPGPPRTLSNLGISRFASEGPELTGRAVGALVSAETNSGVEGDFGRVVSGSEIRFPGNGDRPQAETRFECGSCAALSPSVWRWRGHSAGISLSRTTPMPWGSRPSMVAFTRSGARNTSEIVMFTFLAVHPSRSAMLSVFAAGSLMSSFEPSAPPRNRCDQKCAVLGTDRTDVLRCFGFRHKNLPAPGGWCLAPRNRLCCGSSASASIRHRLHR